MSRPDQQEPEPYVLVPVALLIQARNMIGMQSGGDEFAKIRRALEAEFPRAGEVSWLEPIAEWARLQISLRDAESGGRARDDQVASYLDGRIVTVGNLRSLVAFVDAWQR